MRVVQDGPNSAVTNSAVLLDEWVRAVPGEQVDEWVRPVPDELVAETRTRPTPREHPGITRCIPPQTNYLAGSDLYYRIRDKLDGYDDDGVRTSLNSSELSTTLPVAVIVGDVAHYVSGVNVINGQLWLDISAEPYMELPEAP